MECIYSKIRSTWAGVGIRNMSRQKEQKEVSSECSGPAKDGMEQRKLMLQRGASKRNGVE